MKKSHTNGRGHASDKENTGPPPQTETKPMLLLCARYACRQTWGLTEGSQAFYKSVYKGTPKYCPACRIPCRDGMQNGERENCLSTHLFFVSARTIKRHHHHQAAMLVGKFSSTCTRVPHSDWMWGNRHGCCLVERVQEG